MFRINNLYHFGIIIKYKTIDNLFDVLSNIDKKYVLNLIENKLKEVRGE